MTAIESRKRRNSEQEEDDSSSSSSAVTSSGDTSSSSVVVPQTLHRNKRHKSDKREPRLVLDFRNKLLGNILSFLTLQEGLELRRLCRESHTNYNLTSSIFRYCSFLENDALADRGYDYAPMQDFYRAQCHVICSLSPKLIQSFLRNQTISEEFLNDFIQHVIDDSKRDRPEIVAILLQDARIEVSCKELENALKKGHAKTALLLQQDERIKPDITMCTLCNTVIGCHDCINELGNHCVSIDKESPKYCQACATKHNCFCKGCSDFICHACLHGKAYRSCVECNSIFCLDDYCKDEYCICEMCCCTKCLACIEKTKEHWEYHHGHADFACLCPSCQRALGPTEDYSDESD